MFSKLGTRTLLLLVAGLLAVWGISKWWNSRDGGNTLRSTVVEVDTAALRSFSILPKQLKHAEIRFDRETDGWTVGDSAGVHGADQAAVRDLLAGFAHLRTLRLAGSMEKDAVRYALGDTANTRMIFRVEGKAPLTFRVGWVDQTASQEGATFVNVEGEQDIHVISGSLTRMLDRPMSVWRDQQLIGGDPATWTRLTFTVPGGLGYSLQREGAGWLLDGKPTNAERVQQFFEALSKGRNNRYADDTKVDGLTAQYRLVIQDNATEPAIIEMFDTGGKLLLHNSRKPREVFLLDRTTDLARFFRPAQYLLEVQPQALPQ
ncbi:MAG: DUF4340 domain-containing protein [Flavobacteriales bacterium]